MMLIKDLSKWHTVCGAIIEGVGFKAHESSIAIHSRTSHGGEPGLSRSDFLGNA